MSKKKIYYAEAKRLYVIEGMTLEEIAARFNIAVRTIKYWKDGEDWDVQRREFLESRQVYHEDAYFYARKLLWAINEDFNDGRTVSAGRMHRLAEIIESFIKEKRPENKVREFFGMQ